MLKNGVGGLNGLGVEVLGVDSVLGMHIARFKSQRGARFKSQRGALVEEEVV